MKFCLFGHCWHSVENTFKVVIKESYCKIEKINYYQWEEKCCRCSKIKKVSSIHLPIWSILTKINSYSHYKEEFEKQVKIINKKFFEIK